MFTYQQHAGNLTRTGRWDGLTRRGILPGLV